MCPKYMYQNVHRPPSIRNSQGTYILAPAFKGISIKYILPLENHVPQEKFPYYNHTHHRRIISQVTF